MRTQRLSYQSQGWASLGIFLEEEALQFLRDALENWAQHIPPNAYGLLFHNVYQHIPAFKDLILNGRLENKLKEFLECPELLFFQDNLVCKLPGNPTEIQWHQDYSYWPLDRPGGITAWLALDDAHSENGAMWHVPESHQWGERSPTDFIKGSNQPFLEGLSPMNPELYPQSFTTARAGELLVHHPLLWHRSGANHTALPRRAWTSTWVFPDVCWAPDHAPHPYTWSRQPVAGTPFSL